jgi:RimJ/RimL family protein N-acetyltransferase
MQNHLFDIENILITSRTVIRRFKEQDGEALFNLIQDNRERLDDRFSPLSQIHSIEESAAFVHQKLSEWYAQTNYSLAVWDTDSANIIGYVELHHIDWDIPKAEGLLFIDRDYEGQGIMTEVVMKLLAFIFEQLKLKKINLIIATDNYAAQRLARKCGFRREGDLRNELKKSGGELSDAMLLGFTDQDYFKV